MLVVKKITTTIAAAITLINKLDSYINNKRKEEKGKENYLIKATIESTGNIWITMHEALEQQKEVELSCANPLKTKAIAEAKIKSDNINSAVLADLA